MRRVMVASLALLMVLSAVVLASGFSAFRNTSGLSPPMFNFQVFSRVLGLTVSFAEQDVDFTWVQEFVLDPIVIAGATSPARDGYSFLAGVIQTDSVWDFAWDEKDEGMPMVALIVVDSLDGHLAGWCDDLWNDLLAWYPFITGDFVSVQDESLVVVSVLRGESTIAGSAGGQGLALIAFNSIFGDAYSYAREVDLGVVSFAGTNVKCFLADDGLVEFVCFDLQSGQIASLFGARRIDFAYQVEIAESFGLAALSTDDATCVLEIVQNGTNEIATFVTDSSFAYLVVDQMAARRAVIWYGFGPRDEELAKMNIFDAPCFVGRQIQWAKMLAVSPDALTGGFVASLHRRVGAGCT